MRYLFFILLFQFPHACCQDWEIGGVTEIEASQFLVRLKRMVTDDSIKLDPSLFDLNLKVLGKSRSYEWLLENVNSVFTPNVIASIQSQSVEGLFVNYQGVMIGDGQVWFAGRGQGEKRKLIVIAINTVK